MIASLPATWLGMNVVNGWEERMGMFPTIVAGSVMAASMTFLGALSFFLFWPNRQVKVCVGGCFWVLWCVCWCECASWVLVYAVGITNITTPHHTLPLTQNKARELQVLQDLLMYHMDDLDDVIVALKDQHGQIQRPDFERLVRRAQTTRIMYVVFFAWGVWEVMLCCVKAK